MDDKKLQCMADWQAAGGGGGGRELELLKGITGAFRPGVLTALMGASRTWQTR